MIIYFLQLFLLPSTTATAGVFDLAEYRRVSYDANIGENFLWFAPELDIRKVTASNIDDLEKRIVNRIPDDSTEQNLMFVTSKGGQKFACSLPDVEDVKKDKPKSSKNPKIYGDALAASFYVDKCVKLRGNHWWSYILCRGQTIEQVHGEPGQEGYVKNILGLFDGSLKMPSYQESTDDRLLFVEETYTSGTFCDLEEYREPRMTSVRYECDAQLSTNEVYISSVVEVKPCQYLMIVKVGTLCRYPEFLPASQSNTKKIGCQPFLRKEDVRQLLERQLEEKQKAEESQRVLTVKKRKFQRAAERFNAMTKSQRNLHIPDVVKRINAEMDYHAAHFNLLVAGLELEGKPITQKKRDYMWKLFSTADISDYIFYSDYDTVNDENRGHLWYYFHDPSWPRNQFPKDIMATAVQNGYLSEVQKNLKGTQYRFGDNDELVEGLTHFLKTGEIDLQSNLVIPAMDIYDEMVFIGVRDQPYKWLYDLYEFYHEERDLVAGSGLRAQDVIEGMLHKILKPKYKSWFPMGNLARNSLVILLDEVWEDIIELSTNGLESELLDSSSPNYKAIYDMVDIGNASPEQLKTKNGKNLKFTVSVSAQRDLYEIEAEFQQLLTPIYKLLSIQWFQCRRPNYFHVHPPSEEHLEPSDTTEDFIFHMNLARDMSRFARLMTEVFVVKIQDFTKWRNDKPIAERFVEDFIVWPMPPHATTDANENAFINLHKDLGPQLILEVKERIWNSKVEKYRTEYWTKDYKMRRQAQSMQGLMKDLLSMKDDKDAFVSVGSATSTTTKQASFDERLLKMMSESDLDSSELLESLKNAAGVEEKVEFFDMEDMNQVLDMLDKAGLSKKAEVQIKMFDGDGNEIKSDELDSVTRNLLDVVDATKRFKDVEKAYSTKIFDDSSENLDDDEENRD